MDFDALIKIAEEKYKSFETPDFSFVQNTHNKNPYNSLISKLQEIYKVTEDTDPNEDVSFVYELSKDDQSVVLQLSMLGPYAVILQNDGVILQESSQFAKEFFELLRNSGIEIMSKDILEKPVKINLFNTDPGNAKIYQVFFSDTDLLPWEKA